MWKEHRSKKYSKKLKRKREREKWGRQFSEIVEFERREKIDGEKVHRNTKGERRVEKYSKK